MTRLAVLRWLAVALTLGCLGTQSACSRDADHAPEPQQSAVPVDPTLLAFLSRARSAHHRADLVEGKHPERAIAALEEFIDGPLPAGGTSLAEVREVFADTHARIADLRSQAEDFAEASRHVALGLELARELSYFRGHLFEVRGLLEERRAKAAARQAKRLLSQADNSLEGAAREELERLQASVRSEQEQAEQDPDSRQAKQDLASAERKLDDFRFSHLSANQRQAHRALVRDRERAVALALEAFEQSMEIQAAVIAARTSPTSRPDGTPSSSASPE